MTKAARRDLSVQTRLVHEGTTRSGFGETSEALYLTQGFVYESAEAAEARFKGDDPGFVYSRYGNPTVEMFEKRMCALEGAEDARAMASGMAAVTAALVCQVSAGDHVVAARALFGSCRWVVDTLLPRLGVESTLVDGTRMDEWQAAVRPNTKVFFLESPTNPTLEVIDIAAVARLADANGAKVVVDNVFATPLLQKPLELGAHIVVYSATKHIDGQGRCLGGIVLGSESYVNDHLHNFLKHTGPSLSPFNAWVMVKGLETLPIRVRQQCTNAAQVAAALTAQKPVKRVIYCGAPDHPQAELAARQMRGGGQEMGRRAGTENVIGIAGFGAAAEAAARDLADGIWDRVAEFRNILEKALEAGARSTIFVGKEADRLPNTSCFATPGWKGETQVMQMDLAGFAISAGSACSSGKVNRASKVLLAMGCDEMTASSAIRVSIGPTTTKAELDSFASAWISAYRRWKAKAA